MKRFQKQFSFPVVACGLACVVVTAAAQESAPRRPGEVGRASEPRLGQGVPNSAGAPDGIAPGGPDGGRGFGGRGGPMMLEIKLVEKFDKDGDEKLDGEERKAAREYLARERAEGRLGRGFGGPGGGGRRGQGAPPPLQGAERTDQPANNSVRPEGAPRPGAAGSPDSLRPPVGGPGGGMPPFGGRRNQPPPQPGPKLDLKNVKGYPGKSLYDPKTLRTLFLDFSEADWEKELEEFKNTDVDVPAKLSVDGKSYKDEVGVHFRGMSSFMMVGEGYKRSFGVRIDYENSKQDLKGYTHLDLLNSHEDPSFMRAVLYYQVARDYLPAPKANFVRLAINGESWGVYANIQHFNKEFVQEWYGTKKGARWKVLGSPMARGGLEYLGDDPEPYKSRFELKSKDEPKAWVDLVNLCRVLNQTPADQLMEKIGPILDIDETLRFLALDNALINNDGYWIRSSDYCMYEDLSGQFHILPRDANETFARPGGPGFGGGGRGGRGRDSEAQPERGPAQAASNAGQRPSRAPGAANVGPENSSNRIPPPGADSFAGGPGFGFPRGPQVKGVELDPLIAVNDASKPLASKLLTVPELRERYLAYIKDIAEKWLDWERLGPIAKDYAALIAEDVKADTRKLESTEAFERSVDGDPNEGAQAGVGPRSTISLQEFARQRRAYLLSYPAIEALAEADSNSKLPRSGKQKR